MIFNLDATAAKTHTAKVYITNTNKASQKNFIGEFSVRTNGAGNGVIFKGSDEQVLAGSTNGQWTADLIMSDEQTKFYNDGLAESGSNVVIEWSTGKKDNKIFSNNAAL